ncbi:MAG: ERAP1-like C-terminal domain-containing protein, partial [Silvibacterium sp.]
YANIVADLETGLSPEERISFVGDEWAKVRANKAPVGEFLNLASGLKDDSSADTIDTALTAVGTIAAQIASTPEEREALARWTRRNFEPAYERLGAPSPQDSPGKQELRAKLFGFLGQLGKDPQVIAQAKELAEKYLRNQDSVDPTLAQTALEVAAANGDAAFFDQLQKVFETSNDPELQVTALHLLGDFREPSLEKRAFEYAVSGKVRNQDSVMVLTRMVHAPGTRDVAWQLVQQDWPQVQAQITTMMGGRLVGASGSFCSAEKRDEVLSFYSVHKVPAAARALPRARDQINDCIELRSAQEGNLKTWIASQQ